MAHQFFRYPRVRIRVFTQRIRLCLAKPALTARYRKRHNHAIADVQVVHLSTHFDDFAHELMPEYIASLHRRNESVVHVQVGTADRGRRDSYDRVLLIEYLW